MRPRALKLLLLTALLVAPNAGVHASADFTCPRLQLAEKLAAPPPSGWVPPPPGDIGQQFPGGWLPDFAEIFHGNPALRMTATPSHSEMTNTGGIVTWQFAKPAANLWLGCQYGGLMLAREIPAGVTVCRAEVTQPGAIAVLCQ